MTCICSVFGTCTRRPWPGNVESLVWMSDLLTGRANTGFLGRVELIFMLGYSRGPFYCGSSFVELIGIRGSIGGTRGTGGERRNVLSLRP